MICLIAVLAIYSPMHPRHAPAFRNAVEVCEEIVERAHDASLVDPVLVVAVASEETRFQRDLESPSGAVGALQILPEYWCPREGACNSIDAGISALNYYMLKYEGDELRALTGYAGSGRRARKYARRVMKRVAHIRATLDAL